MNIGDRILAAFNRSLIRMMEYHNNSIQLTDGTVLVRHSAEYYAQYREQQAMGTAWDQQARR